MLKRAVVGLAVVTISLSLAACGKQKKEALAGLEKIEQACKDKKKDEAKKLGDELRAGNEAFKKAIDGATESVKDKEKINWCGALVLSETKLRIENGPAL